MRSQTKKKKNWNEKNNQKDTQNEKETWKVPNQEQIIFYAYVPATKKQPNTHTKKNQSIHTQIQIQNQTPHRFTYGNLKRVASSSSGRGGGGCGSSRELCEYTNAPIAKNALFRLFYFVHITKTAGVALKKCLQEQCAMPTMSSYAPQNLLLQGTPVVRNKKRFPSYTRFLSKGHLTVNELDCRMPTLCILREPLSRVRSAFRFLAEGGKHGEVWQYPERAMMELFRAHRIASLSDIFELQNTALKKRILEHPHFRPQSEFICAPNTTDVLVDHVFVLESFDAKAVANVLHIHAFTLEHRNKSEFEYELSHTDKEYITDYYKDDIEIYKRYS